jgi:PhnB protein
MSVTVTPHLNFRGDAREALEFYRAAFDGDLAVVTYDDVHNVQDPSDAGKVTWGQVSNADGVRVMAYDVPAGTAFDRGEGSFFVSVRGDDADALRRYWQRLSDEATIVVDLAPAGWSPLYGMLRDRFGVVWVLDIEVAYAG